MESASPPVESILAAAVEISTDDERREFVKRACAGDAELKRRVEELITNHFRAGSFLESPAPQLVATIDAPIPERPGTVIGPYKLLEQIGEGGFGVVFMAEQTQPVRRKVALKVLKPGMDTCQIVARFEAERQALAIMDHPNIAKVHDGGATASGRPFFVMELVKGVPITEFCDQNQLTPPQRLELFLPVCQAVQHAHQKGIIHRDLKPSNVLVSRHDATPVVKVIDFGVAKALGQELTDKTLFTGLAQMVGTPLYMSPEQAGMSDLDVDTRSDIYSLGVLLYELLTGTTPFDKERFKKSEYDEIRRIIREEEPPKPSTRLSTSETLPSIAANRGLEPKKLSSLVRGELDWIVMKCLQKDRSRRYETASSLARDLERYLLDEPVQARPPSAAYRLRKFMRRNKGPVLAASLVLVALIGGMIGTSWGLLRALSEAEEKGQAQQAAESNLRKAHQAVNDYFMLVSENDLLQEPALQPLRRKLLHRALVYYQGFVRDHGESPELQAELAATCLRIAILTFELGVEEDWVPWLEKGVAAVEGLLQGKCDVSALESLSSGQRWIETGFTLAVHDRDKTLRALDKAREVWEELVRRYPAVPGFQSDLAAFYNVLGALHDHSAVGGLRERSEEEKAEAFYSRSCELRRKLVEANPGEPQYRACLVRILSCFGAQRVRRRQVAEAEKDLRHALATARQLVVDFPGRPGWRDLLGLMYQELGFLLEHVGRLDEAEAAYREMLAGYDALRAKYPSVPSYADGAFRARLWLGEVLCAAGRRLEAAELFRQGLALGEESNWQDPAARNRFAWLLANCADAGFRNPPKAVVLAGNVVSQVPKTGDYWMTLGGAHYRAGDYRAAVEALEKAVQLPTDFDTSPARFFLAMAHWQLGQKDQAKARYREGVEQMNHEYLCVEPCRVRVEAEELLGIKKD